MLDLCLLCADLNDPCSELRRSADAGIGEVCAFLRSPSERTADLLAGWREEFRYLYGDVETGLTGSGGLDARALLAGYGIHLSKEEDPAEAAGRLFFSIQTWFSLLVKWMTRDILDQWRPMDGEDGWEDIILGRFARRRGILHYCEADWYCWPVFELERGFGRVLEGIAANVARYRVPMTLEGFVRHNDHDCVRQMYETMLPRQLRHALGEYYTPDWLAQLTLKEALALHGGRPADACILDPACGSGAFLLQSIREKRRQGRGLEDILDTVAGFDINPLAVLTAGTNYLLAVIDLLPPGKEMAVPVYNVDVIRFPQEGGEEGEETDLASAPRPARAVRRRIARDRQLAAQIGQADLVVGNPPWVNWEHLPQDYRDQSRRLWADYGLFSGKGRERSFSKEDVSVLITYVAADRLLKREGVLAFLLPSGLFKSERNGAGFRRFTLRDGCGLKALKVADLTPLKPFERISVGAALFFARKGEKTTYPVPYQVWERRKKGKHTRFHTCLDLETALERVRVREWQAVPSVAGDPASPWITADPALLAALTHVLGTNGYKARTGVFTGGANGVYWLRVLGEEQGMLRVANVGGRAKREVRGVTALIEPDYVFPMVRGGGVSRWHAVPDTWLLCPHTARTRMWPVPGEKLAQHAPATYAYLSSFREALDGRRGFAGWEKEIQRQEFHAVLRVGEYTFAPYKVVWRYIATQFICAVVSRGEDPWLGQKLCLPNEKLMYVGLEDGDEAYYLCGLLSSAPVACCVKSYMNPTSISAHVLDKLNIPAYDPAEPRHRRISALCRAGHGAEDITPFLREIDVIAAGLYGMDEAQLDAMR